jgi:hypothetical protein
MPRSGRVKEIFVERVNIIDPGEATPGLRRKVEVNGKMRIVLRAVRAAG